MAGKIFYREREKYVDGSKTPRFQLIGLLGVDMKIQGHHLRMSELKFISEAAGAELVRLPRGPKHEEEDVEV